MQPQNLQRVESYGRSDNIHLVWEEGRVDVVQGQFLYPGGGGAQDTEDISSESPHLEMQLAKVGGGKKNGNSHVKKMQCFQ